MLETARHANARKDYIDEIIGIERDEKKGYVLDLMTAGAVVFKGLGFHEA